MSRAAVTPKRRAVARLLRRDRLGLARAARAGVVPDRSGTALVVYSRSSAPTVRRFVDAVVADGWDVRLWALDEPAPALADRTVGSGPGSRYVQLNRLHATVDGTGTPVALVDDDVELVHGGLSWLAGIAGACGLDAYQPAHTHDSVVSWRLTYRRPATVARRTDFVEEGPLTVLGPAARERLLPLDETVPQAGGVDFSWRRRHPGLRLGIIDAVTFRHLRPLGGSYTRDDAFRAIEAELARQGVQGHPRGAMRTLASWRAWQPAPPRGLQP